jgi:hypothetical protein
MFIKRLAKKILKKLGFEKVEKLYTSRKDLNDFIAKLIPFKVDLQRIGGKNDGGYLIPSGFNPSVVFSPGVYNDDSFEKYFALRNVPCYLADFSVDTNPTSNNNLHFDKKYIGTVLGGDNFWAFDDWVSAKGNSNNNSMLLQMDIEGWEYNNIINASRATLNRFDVLCIEFHNFHAVGYKHGFRLMSEVFNKLLLDFVPVHVHPNNCCKPERIHNVTLPVVVEFTFYKRSKMLNYIKVDKIMNINDSPNLIGEPDLSIEDWLTVLN